MTPSEFAAQANKLQHESVAKGTVHSFRTVYEWAISQGLRGKDYEAIFAAWPEAAQWGTKTRMAYMTYAEEREGYMFTPGKSHREATAEVVKYHAYVREY